jgi:hypothetical protein
MKIFDLETDGFLDELTQIYCGWVLDTDTGEFHVFNNQNNGKGSIADMVDYLSTGDLLAHNGIDFDYRVIWKLYPNWAPQGKLLDTLTMSRLIWTNLKDIDFGRRAKRRFSDFPGNLIGSHSLKAWGYRLGAFKGDFSPKQFINMALVSVSKTEDNLGIPWADSRPLKRRLWRKSDIATYLPLNVLPKHTWGTIGWTQSMEDYCRQDVVVTQALHALICSKGYSETAISLEHDFAWIIKRQEAFGWKFNEEAASELHRVLKERQASLADRLSTFFPPWVEETEFIPKVDNKSLGYKKGIPFIKKKTVHFNPSSRDHITGRLTALYGWKPTEFGDNGKPTVDETTLKGLDYEPVPLLMDYLMVDKRLGQVAEGKQAWLKKVVNGRIHGRINTMGAITGRCTHSNPNVAQVPAGGAEYGAECRQLFTVDTGYVLVGADASGLELRCLAHYMAAFDGGAYAHEVVEGDAHWVNLMALLELAGVPREKGNKAHEDARDAQKTWIYAFLYGCGVLSSGVNWIAIYEAYYGIKPAGDPESLGKKARSAISTGLPALGSLLRGVQKKAKATKTLKGLDGRILHVRSQHAALNTLLQSAGAIIMKRALVELDTLLQAAGLKHSWQSASPDYEFVGNIHDEFQIQVKREHAELVASLCPKAMTLAGEYFGFRCRIDGEAKVGPDWSKTH